MQMEGKRITSFRDLEVYQSTYNACIRIMQELLPNLPEYEKFDLKEQLRRSVRNPEGTSFFKQMLQEEVALYEKRCS